VSRDSLDRIADRIAEVSQDLDDVMFTMLREAAASRRGRPADDKRLMQVRRALDKAEHLLRAAGSTPDSESDGD
jgi:hypothetical protein